MGEKEEFVRFILKSDLTDKKIEECISVIKKCFDNNNLKNHLKTKDSSNYGCITQEIGGEEETVIEHSKMIEFQINLGFHTLDEIREIIAKDILDCPDCVKNYIIPQIIQRICKSSK